MSDVFFMLVYLSFICSLLFRISIRGKILVLNGVPMILCFIYVCLKALMKSLFCSVVRVRTRSN